MIPIPRGSKWMVVIRRGFQLRRSEPRPAKLQPAERNLATPQHITLTVSCLVWRGNPVPSFSRHRGK